MAFDVQRFKDWLVTVKGLADETADKKGTRLRAAMRDYGFDITAFRKSNAGAMAQGSRYLARRRREPSKRTGALIGPMTYDQDVWMLNDLAEFVRRKAYFEPLKVPDQNEPHPLSPDEERRILAWDAPKAGRWWCPKCERTANKRGRAASTAPEDAPLHKRCGTPLQPHAPQAMHGDRKRLVKGALHFEAVHGLRPGESCEVRITHFEPDGEGGMWMLVDKPGKLGFRRWLWCPKHLMSPKRPFGAYWLWRLSVQDQCASDHLWVVCNWRAKVRRYRKMSKNTFRAAIRLACRDQGVKANPSRLRDTVLTRIALDEKGKSDIMDAQHQAGHKRVDTTRRRYVKYKREDFRRRARQSQSDRFALSQQEETDGS